MRAIALFAGRAREVRIRARLIQGLEPIVGVETRHGEVRFLCTDALLEYRARTLLSKEPDTIEWIDGFRAGEVLWDIGANVGTYSLYAAAGGATVLAFEPGPGNYYVLARNIELNGRDGAISAYCMAFSDVTRLDTFHMSSTVLGGSLNAFGPALDWRKQAFDPKFRQAAVGFSVDDFVARFAPVFPAHIKIDVDGIEKQILLGAAATLKDARLKSVLVELNPDWPDYDEIFDIMRQADFWANPDQLGIAGQARTVANHLFTRRPA